MNMLTYDFNDFLRRMSSLNYPNILIKAEQEGRNVERGSSKVKGAVERRKMGSIEYAHKIKAFLFFMRYVQKPAGVSDEDFQKYLEVVKPLVDKSQLKSSILAMFSKEGEASS